MEQLAIAAAKKYSNGNELPQGEHLEVYINAYVAAIGRGEPEYEANKIANIAVNKLKLEELGI